MPFLAARALHQTQPSGALANAQRKSRRQQVMAMHVGTQLRTAREQRGLSLDDLSKQTKLKVSVLQALEEGNVDALPPPSYVRGYVRVLAAEFGLDANDLASRYHAFAQEEQLRLATVREQERLQQERDALQREQEERKREREERERQRQLTLEAIERERVERERNRQLRMEARQAARLDRERERQFIREAKRAKRAARQTRLSASIAAARAVAESRAHDVFASAEKWTHNKPAMAAAVLLLALIAFLSFPTGDDQSQLNATTARATSVAPTSPSVATPQTPSDQRFRIELNPVQPTYVSATADDRSALSRELRQGEREAIEARDRVVLRVSDPAALQWSIDGRPAKAPGRPGEAVTMTITRANLHEFVGH
jgi:hypothetical protein